MGNLETEGQGHTWRTKPKNNDAGKESVKNPR